MTEDESLGKSPKKFRKGDLVRVNPDAYQASLEYLASDKYTPNYIFEGPGEILTLKAEYAQIRWRKPVPDVWLRVDQLESWS